MGAQHVQIRLLGGFEVQVDGVAVPARVWRLNKARSLLKLLALTDGNRLHRDAIAEVLWPELGTVAGTNNLHQALHAARRALAAAGASAGVLRLRDGVVALCPDGGLETDVQDLEEALLKALASDDPDRLLDIAVRWAPGLLPEDRYEDWLRPQQERAAGMHRTAVLASANGLIAQGRGDEAASALKSVADARPTDEEVHRALITAYDTAGRRWDAIATYESLRSHLDDEYAAAPEVETTTLYRRLLTCQADARAGAFLHLPAPRTRFLGRQREIEELVALCTRNRLVTLSGPGGAGKTRLAVEVARALAKTSAYADGLWMVDLSGVRDAELILATAASALKLTLSGARPTVAVLTAQLAARELVVVLDNCEHVIDAAAELVRAMMDDCPGITILATSREPLHLPGEIAWRVPSLRVPGPSEVEADRLMRYESVQLFATRAQEAAPAFRLDNTNAPVIAHICHRLDGLPLAIELAAAQAAYLAPKQIASLLDNALLALTSRLRGTPDRQATLAATVVWSYDLLDPMSACCCRGSRCSRADSPSQQRRKWPPAGWHGRLPRFSLDSSTSRWSWLRRSVRMRRAIGCMSSCVSTRPRCYESLTRGRVGRADTRPGTAIKPNRLTPNGANPSSASRATGSQLNARTCGSLWPTRSNKTLSKPYARQSQHGAPGWPPECTRKGSSGCAAPSRHVPMFPRYMCAPCSRPPFSKCAWAGWKRHSFWVVRLPTLAAGKRTRRGGPRPRIFIACLAGWPRSGRRSINSSTPQMPIFGTCHLHERPRIICGPWLRSLVPTPTPHSPTLRVPSAG